MIRLVDERSYSTFVSVPQAHLPEGDSPAVSDLRLQTPSHHSSAALHQPGSHQGTHSLRRVCYCLCRYGCLCTFLTVLASNGILPSLILFETSPPPLISLFLCVWIFSR